MGTQYSHNQATIRTGEILNDSFDSVSQSLVGRNTPFRELLVAQKNIVFDLKSVYGITYRDVVATEGSGAVTNEGGEYKLATTANGADSATLDTAEPGRYQAGSSAQVGIRIRRPSAPTGDQELLWGYLDSQNGLAFGENATSPFILRRSGSTDATKVQQADWNVDTLDGTGPNASNPSGLELKPEDGHIYHIEFSWYGSGPIEWQVLMADGNNRQQTLVVHRERLRGGVSFENPNLPIQAKVSNGGTASALELFVAGRQFSILGDYNPDRRVTGDMREDVTVSDTFIPLVSLRRKSEFPSGVNNHVSVKVQGFDILSDSDLVYRLVSGATLTGASPQTPTGYSAGQTSLESDVSATAVSGGEVVYPGMASGGTPNDLDLTQRDFRFDFINNDWLTLIARKKTGETDANVAVTLRAREEF